MIRLKTSQGSEVVPGRAHMSPTQTLRRSWALESVCRFVGIGSGQQRGTAATDVYDRGLA